MYYGCGYRYKKWSVYGCLVSVIKVLAFRRRENAFLIDDAPPQDLVGNTIEHLPTQRESEFLKMVGLPACGGTYWALKHMEAKPEGKLWSFGTECRDRSDESGRIEQVGELR